MFAANTHHGVVIQVVGQGGRDEERIGDKKTEEVRCQSIGE